MKRQRGTQGRTPCEDQGRDWSETVATQGRLAGLLGKLGGARKAPFLGSLEGADS